MRRRAIYAGLIAALLLTLSCSKNDSTGPETAIIKGTVTADGVGAGGVTIYLYPYVITSGGSGKAEAAVSQMETAGAGYYEIIVLPGTYRISYSARIGGLSLSANRYPVDVESNDDVVLNVELKDPAPANLIISDGDGVVAMTFDGGYLSASHRIYRSVAGENDFTTVGTTYGGHTTLSFSDSPPAAGNYSYKITALNSLGESAPVGPVDIAYTATPFTPSGFFAREMVNHILLTWNRGYYFSGEYKIYRTSSGNSWALIGLADDTGFVDVPPAYGTYQYRVTSMLYGNESNPTNAVSIDYDGRYAAPAGLAISDRGSNILLEWVNMGDAGYFNIYRFTALSGQYVLIDSTMQSSFVDRPSTNNEYFYKISIVSPHGLESELSAAVNCLFDNQLDPPNHVNISEQGTTLQIYWDQIEWANNYVLYRSNDGETYDFIKRVFGITPETNDTPLDPGDYYYRVSTETMDGVEGQPSLPAYIHFSDSLSTPEGLRAYSYGTYIGLYWEDVYGANYFIVYRSNSPDADYQIIDDNASNWQFEDQPPQAGPYYYKVRAVDTLDNVSPMSLYAYVYFANEPPPPTNVTAQDRISYVELSWDSGYGIDSFFIFRANSAYGSYEPIDTLQVNFSIRDWPPSPGHYYYRIQAIDNNRLSELSDFGHVNFTGHLPPPTNLQGYDIGSNVVLTWEDAGNAVSFDIFRGTTPEALTLVLTAYDNIANDNPGAEGTYFYAVRAKTQGGLPSDLTEPIMVVFAP